MFAKLTVIAAYFAAVITIGYFARARATSDDNGYYLGGRLTTPFVLIATMLATNFSAFTVFGASGAGYRDGLAFLPIMAFGTGFMALSFLLIGPRVRKLGADKGLVTPAELVAEIYDSKALSLLFAGVLVFFTLPYLAMQPYAGGMAIGSLFGIPHWIGAAAITIAICLYTLRGGFRAVSWTDALQGTVLTAMMLLALVVVVVALGGWSNSLEHVRINEPALFSRPGASGSYTPAVWFGFLLLWFFCDPMFPQLFQRLYAARDNRSISLTVLAYPAVCLLAFAPPVLMGVLGHSVFSGMKGKEADAILPRLLEWSGGDVMGALIITAGIAALMSTMDSQLLTLSSILRRDLGVGKANKALDGRMLVILLAGVGLAVALWVNSSILDLGVTAFTGLAVLFPTVLFGLYLRKPAARSAFASILVGETVAALAHFKLLPSTGMMPAVAVILASTLSYVIVQVFCGGLSLKGVTRRGLLFVLAFGCIFAGALDFYNWGTVGGLLFGLPLWLWFFIGLSILQTALVYLCLRLSHS